MAKIPTPSQIRASRIKYLVFIAGTFLEAEVPTHLLCDKLEASAFRLWPFSREETRKDYVRSALRTVISRPPAESVLPEAEQVPRFFILYEDPLKPVREPVDASEDEGGGDELMAEALDQATRGRYFGVPGPLGDDDPDDDEEAP